MKVRAKRLCTVLIVLAVTFLTALAIGFIGRESAADDAVSGERTELKPISENKVVIVSQSGTDYILTYSSDSLQQDQSMAEALKTLMQNTYGTTMPYVKPDIATSETEHEILIGNTNRQESIDFHKKVTATLADEDDMAWGYAYVNGKLLFTANNKTAYELGQGEFLNYLISCDFTVPDNLHVIKGKTRAEYDEEKRLEYENDREKYIASLIARNNEFTQADFGGDPQQMPTDLYESPHTYPTENQHPRYFLANADLDELYYNFTSNPEYAEIRKTIWEYADKVRGDAYTGIFPEKTGSSGEIYRFSTDMIAQFEAKAFVYLMTGDATYGYEAIIGAKNAILSLHYTTDLHMDVYHGPSQVMVNVAKVYDWCYDLLTEDDKNQIIAGVSNILGPQMESGMRFPPKGMNAVSGHGTGPQFIRDWMTVAIVFYDEMPSWWEMVGGRFYQYYVPVINIASESGWASQGTVTYGDSKYMTRSWAAFLVKTTTGEFPYTEDFRKCAYYYFSYIQPNGKYFQTGDGGRTADGCGISDSCAYMFIAAALFDDPTIGAMAKYYSSNYTKFSYAFTTEMTAPDMLIFLTLGPDIEEEPMENIDTIQYFESPAATMTARTDWTENAAAVLMRIGTMTMANHDLADHGTFQIYYKGLLAGTSGAYKKYGGYVHKYYLQATVAHNGLLVYDPSLSDAEPIYKTVNCGEENCDHSDCTTIDYNTIVNAARYYYSGGQRTLDSPADIETWTSGTYDMGTLIGASWEYRTDGSAKYAYIAGDITAAYPSKTVSYAARKMLTLFTGDEDLPLLFFTYDQLTSKGADYTKTWLLHTVNEPQINEDELTATVTAGDGRLVLQSLSGADAITKIGGKGKDFWINGKNCTDEYTDEDAYYEQIWGRIELSTTGELSDSFFTAMYVTDADSTKTLDIKTKKTEIVEYAAVLNYIVAFTNTGSDGQSKEFSFETDETGLLQYYISGMESGTWRVKVDGLSVATVFADDGEGFVSFIAPAGTVTLTPSDDVIGANGGRIKYSAGGGTLGPDTIYTYRNETATQIPTDIVKADSYFIGWYTSPSFEPDTLITEIPAGHTGTVYLYAKWLSNILNVNYNDVKQATLNVSTGSSKVNGITYNTNSSEGVSFAVKEDSEGIRYLDWQKGTKSAFMTTTNNLVNYASMTVDDECASFTITLSKNGEAQVPESQFRIYTRKDINGKEGSEYISRQYIFTTNTKGEVRLGNTSSGPVAAVLTEEKTTLRLVMDFKNEEIRAYDVYGNVIAKTSVSVAGLTLANKDNPPGVSSMSEWRTLLDSILMYWICTGKESDSAFKIYEIKIDEGDRFKDLEPEDGMIVYNLGAGGVMPADAPIYYDKGTATELLVPIASDGYTFLGWYSSPDYQEGTEISEIPADYEGAFFAYAKWSETIWSSDFSNTNIDVTAGQTKIDNINYNINDVTGSYFKTNTDNEGVKYLEWYDAGGVTTNPFALMNNGAIALSSDTQISYELTFSKNGNEPLQTFYLRTLAQYDVNGDKLASSNSLPLFKVTSSGIYLSENVSSSVSASDIKISDITDGKMTVRVVIDFVACQIKAYTEDGDILIRQFDIPESSGAENGIEFMKTFTTYVFYMMSTTPQATLNTSVRIYDFKIATGNIFEDSNFLNGKISYVTNGGTLPEDAANSYLPNEETLLPEPVKENSSFGGWYTSPNFASESKITSIPAGTTGMVVVYAKWISVVLTEEYTQTVVDVPESTTEVIAGVRYNAGSDTELKPGSFFVTESDSDGNSYLKVQVEAKNAVMAVMDDSYNLTHFSNTSISYEFDLKKLAETQMPDLTLRLTTSGGNRGSFEIFNLSGASGEVKLKGSDKVFAVVTEERTRLRITVDFESARIYAYGEGAELLDSVELAVPTVKDGYEQPETLLEWQKIATNYTFYAAINRPSDVTDFVAIGFDNLKIYDGNPFAL